MKNYFEAKAKYVKVDETSGKERKVTESFLIDAMSLTETESRLTKELEQIVSGEFRIVSGKESNISEVYPNNNGDRWFKAKVSIIDVDEASGKEKKTNNYMLVEANNVDEAYSYLISCLDGFIVPFEIPSVSESKIMDVFNCTPFEE